MKHVLLARHGQQVNDPADTSLWKRGAILDVTKLGVLRTVRDYYQTARRAYYGNYSSGLTRADETAELLTGKKPTPAIELDPHAIWGDDVWHKVSYQADGKTEMSVGEMMAQHRDIMEPVGLLGANFIRRKVMELGPTDDTVFIGHHAYLFFTTHGPIVDCIAAVLLDQWPFLYQQKGFGKGDILMFDFGDEGERKGHRFLTAERALNPPPPEPRRHPLDE